MADGSQLAIAYPSGSRVSSPVYWQETWFGGPKHVLEQAFWDEQAVEGVIAMSAAPNMTWRASLVQTSGHTFLEVRDMSGKSMQVGGRLWWPAHRSELSS